MIAINSDLGFQPIPQSYGFALGQPVTVI